MRIAYAGNFDHHHCTEVHIAATLEDLGCEVTRLQENRTTLDQIRAACEGADLLLYTRTWNMTREWMCGGGDFLAFLEALPIPSASFHLDLYYGLKRGEGLRSDPFWRTKYVFTPDGAPQSCDFFAQHGVNHFYLRPGVFHRECYRAEPLDRFRCDVTFVGSQGYHPEWPYRGQLLTFLRQKYGRRYQKHGSPQDCVRGHELNQLYASAKVVVGDTLCLGFKHPYYWSDRIYETLGRGGFLIHPRIKGLEDELRDREHCAYYEYGDWRGLRALIDYYVRNDDERERIRAAGHEFVKANCTYLNRMRQMLDTLAQHEPGIAAAWAAAQRREAA